MIEIIGLRVLQNKWPTFPLYICICFIIHFNLKKKKKKNPIKAAPIHFWIANHQLRNVALQHIPTLRLSTSTKSAGGSFIEFFQWEVPCFEISSCSANSSLPQITSKTQSSCDLHINYSIQHSVSLCFIPTNAKHVTDTNTQSVLE